MLNIPAIILAAGRGRRLGPLTDQHPKCLLSVGGRTLIEHQMEILSSCGINQVVVVVGYRADAVRKRLGRAAQFCDNTRHEETNSLYSLWLAREHGRRGFVLLNADVLFDRAVLDRVLQSPHPDALAVERRREFLPEEMKVALNGNRILAMSKTLEPQSAHAENVGVLKFSAAGAKALFSRIEELFAAGGSEKQFAPYAFDAMAAEYPLYGVDVEDLPWIEIDFVDDLLRARESVWPAIQRRRSHSPRPTTAFAPEVVATNPSAAFSD